MAYFNRKAQSLTELATFGTVLLLVLSFFISYGMRYNYQQDLQMRSFRTALSQAYNPTDKDGNPVADRPDASASVVLLDDRHIPDPRDMFGAGNIVPVQAGAEVTWGNTLQEGYPGITDNSLLPKMKYIFNDKNAAHRAEREYTTAGYGFITTGNKFYAILPGNTWPQLINWVDQQGNPLIKCYQPTPDSPKQVMVLLPNHETEVITEVYLKPTGATDTDTRYIKYQVIGVRTDPPDPISPATTVDGYTIDRINLLSPDSAQMNPNYMLLNNDVNIDGTPDVTPANVQGLLLEGAQKIKRTGTLTIQETPGKTISTSEYNFNKNAGDTVITHKIRSSSGVEDINSPFERGMISTWETPK